MGSNRYLTYIWTIVNMIPLTQEPSHNGIIRQGENVYQPLLRGWGGEGRTLAPCSPEVRPSYWVRQTFIHPLLYTNLCYTTLSNATASLVVKIIMKHGKTQ